jgi:GNAT superfamily N-acetyltransferase
MTALATIERLTHSLLEGLAALLAESEQAGWRFLRRLTDEWAVGLNRFNGPGEAVFAAWTNGQLVGICGLNVDPYAGDSRVGRVRHLYIRAECRRRGLGRQLVQTVEYGARGPISSACCPLAESLSLASVPSSPNAL